MSYLDRIKLQAEAKSAEIESKRAQMWKKEVLRCQQEKCYHLADLIVSYI